MSGRGRASLYCLHASSGPSTTISPFTRGNANFHTYVSGNYYDPDQNGALNGFVLSATTDNYSEVDFQAEPYAYPTVSGLLNATAALDYVRAHVGASKSRDRVDTYLIDTELGSLGTVGALITDPTASPMNGPGPIEGGTVSRSARRRYVELNQRQAPADVDADGIPDAWETANGLNPNDASDAMKIASNGYASTSRDPISTSATEPLPQISRTTSTHLYDTFWG